MAIDREDERPMTRDVWVRRLRAAEADRAAPESRTGEPGDSRARRQIERFTAGFTEGAAIVPSAPYRPEEVPLSLEPRRVPVRHNRVRRREAQLEPLYINGADDRQVYVDTRYPWGCVCSVIGPPGIGGSGVLVGPRHVLTASHCVDWRDLDITVEVHRAGPDVRAASPIIAAGSSVQLVDVHESELDEDYAVLVLEQRLGDRFGWFGTRTYESRWDDDAYWWSIGYADDLGGNVWPLWQSWKWLDEDELDYGSARAMTTNADVLYGQSGSPVFGFWGEGNEPWVVGVVSAQHDGDNWCSGGPLLTYLVGEARKKYA